MTQRITREFFARDVLVVAPVLLGKFLCRQFEDGHVEKKLITEVEAYRGEEDLAAHVSKGRTARTEVIYGGAGFVYVYFIYGMYWLINIVTGRVDEPQAALIRGVEGVSGPGRVGKWLQLDRSFYGEDVTISNRLWVEDSNLAIPVEKITQTPRIGVDYAGEWAKKPWRWVLQS